jgi:hypothetical protein
MLHMADETQEDRRWKLDRHVPVVFIIGLVLQAAGIVWWGSQVQSKQEDHERRLTVQEGAKSAERMAVMEEQLKASKELQTTMNIKLDRLLELAFNRSQNRPLP